MGRPERTVGVRELRQNASSILEDVMRTQVPVTVTSHGRPRAVITPIDVAHSHRESLVADGVLTPGSGRVWDVPPVPASVSTEDALAAERAEWR